MAPRVPIAVTSICSSTVINTKLPDRISSKIYLSCFDPYFLNMSVNITAISRKFSADSASAVRETILAATWTLNVNDLILGRTPNALTLLFYYNTKCAERKGTFLNLESTEIDRFIWNVRFSTSHPFVSSRPLWSDQ